MLTGLQLHFSDMKSDWACRGSLQRLGLEQIALGQLHWSVAKYAPPLERVLWEGLAGMYEQAWPQLCHDCHPSV